MMSERFPETIIAGVEAFYFFGRAGSDEKVLAEVLNACVDQEAHEQEYDEGH